MRYLIIVFLGFFIVNTSFAEDTTIEMLNKLDKRSMLYSQDIVRISTGDTVFWKATNPGHNVEFISKKGVPDGVDKFKSKISKDTQFTFTVPGIYAYWCVPHKTLGMIGFIIVDNDLSNLDSIKKVKFIGKSKKIATTLIAKIEG
tara:strand:+ start:282 stop:716 length:435 start_codon:yes stop_codon:yes gene_type:complete